MMAAAGIEIKSGWGVDTGDRHAFVRGLLQLHLCAQSFCPLGRSGRHAACRRNLVGEDLGIIVRRCQELTELPPDVGVRGAACTCRDARSVIGGRVGNLKAFMESRAPALGPRKIGARKEHGKLCSPEPAHLINLNACVAHRADHPAHHVVADEVAHRAVDLLDPVDSHHRQAVRNLIRCQVVSVLARRTTVRGAGQLVDVSQASRFEFGVDRRDALRRDQRCRTDPDGDRDNDRRDEVARHGPVPVVNDRSQRAQAGERDQRHSYSRSLDERRHEDHEQGVEKDVWALEGRR